MCGSSLLSSPTTVARSRLCETSFRNRLSPSWNKCATWGHFEESTFGGIDVRRNRRWDRIVTGGRLKPGNQVGEGGGVVVHRGIHSKCLRQPTNERPIQSRQSSLFCQPDTSVQASRRRGKANQATRSGGWRAFQLSRQRSERRLRQRKVGTSICHLS